MMQTIFSTMDATEDRQICERMVSKNLDLAQRESILFLTGISQESPYYSPPAVKKRGIFQFFFHHALRFASRVENPPLFPSITASASQTSSLSERVVVPSGCDPLSISIPVVDEQPSGPTVSPASVTGDALRVTKAFTPYQLILTLQAARLLSWRRTVPITSVVEEVAQPAKPQNVAGLQTSEARPFLPRCFDSPTGFVTSTLRASLFGSDMDEYTSQEEMTPLLTPLQRAIAQAREHGYHLHPRQSLSVSLSPTSPTSPSLPSPPGLAHLRNRYTLRSHQVAAGDYFRKEATHRAAVAARNLNRHLLIKKADRSLYEPSGIIMPEFELTRLRVVQAPKRFPVRLWKREYRGPADWIEVEERTPMGGPVIFKRDSHLRKELVLRVRRTPVPKFFAPIRSSVDRKAPVAVAEDVKNTQVKPEVPSQIAIQSTERDQEEPSKFTPAQMANLLQIIKRRTKAAEQLSCDGTTVDDHISNVDIKEETSVGDISSPAAAMKPLGLRVDTQVDRPVTPGCLDPVVAEMHRKSLLKKYYNSAPKPSLTPAHIRDAEAAVTPKVVDPSSSEETLCEIAQESAEKIKPSSVEPQKQAPASVSISNMVKLQNASALPVERPSRMSLSPRKALRAVKHQARNLGF